MIKNVRLFDMFLLLPCSKIIAFSITAPGELGYNPKCQGVR